MIMLAYGIDIDYIVRIMSCLSRNPTFEEKHTHTHIHSLFLVSIILYYIISLYVVLLTIVFYLSYIIIYVVFD